MKIVRVAWLVLAVAAAGCIKVDQTLVIQKDGSGVFQLDYSVSEQSVTQMKAMLKLAEQLAGPSGEVIPADDADALMEWLFNPDEAEIKRWLDPYRDAGIVLEKFKTETKNAWRSVELKITFKDLAKLAKTDFFPAYGFSLLRNKAGDYVFHRRASGDLDVGLDFSEPATARTLSPWLAGFRVVSKVNVPGRILDTNAHQRSLYSGAWIFDHNRDVDAVVAMQRQAMTIVFSSSDLRLPLVRQAPSE